MKPPERMPIINMTLLSKPLISMMQRRNGSRPRQQVIQRDNAMSRIFSSAARISDMNELAGLHALSAGHAGGKLRPGPVGVAIALYDIWRRLPPKQRKLALQLARKHGPTAAKKLMQVQRARRGR